nr:TMEM165/GDT1 family protein [Rhodococcus sp. HNM0569]
MTAIALSFGVVFLAELGDKSQLMAMTFALRYRWWVVLSAITAATAVVHLVSVVVGHYLGLALPTDVIGVVGGIAFVIFGLWTLRGDSLSDTEASKAHTATRSAFLAVTSAFFLAELGDKTMLATVTLATDSDPVGVWFGSTVGMVAADALAIVVGAVLGRHLPQRAVELGAAVLFFVFGAWLILESTVDDPAYALVGAAGTAVVGAIAALAWHRTRERNKRTETR